MIKTIAENKKLYLLWIISVVLICACIVTSTLLSAVAFVILIAAALFLAPNEALVFLIALLPFANIFKLSTNSMSLFTVAEIAIVLILIFKIKKIRTSFFLALMALAVYVIVFSLENFNALLVIKFLFGFLLIYFALQTLGTKDAKNIAYLFAAGAIIMMLLTLNQNYLEYVLPYYADVNFLVLSGSGTDMIRASGFFGDPNYCSVFLILTLAMLCTLYYHKQIKTEFWLFFVSIAALGLFTYSKSYFLALCALILFLIVFVLFPKHKGWAIISMIFMAILLFLILDGRIDAVNLMLERFKEKDLTTGRFDINRVYLKYIWDNPMVMFVGDGIGVNVIPSRTYAVHNLYIESIFKLGVIGCGLYLLVLFLGMGDFKFTEKKVADFLPALFMIVMYFFLAGITSYELAFYIAIAFLTLKSVNATVESTDTK